MTGEPFSIRVDARECLSFLDSLSRQAPFAISLAINETLKVGQTMERGVIHRNMTIRRAPFIDRTIKITQFASKRNLAGVIAVDPDRDILAKFEDDGIKRPTSGSALAVPVNVKRSKSDIIVKNMRVRELQLRAHHTKGGKVQLKGLHKTFTVKGANGGAILQRIGRKGHGTLSEEIAAGRIKVLYAFKRSVPIPRNLLFTKTITEAVEKNWTLKMGEAWDRAVRTAR